MKAASSVHEGDFRGIKRLREPPQTFGKHLVIDAHPDADVIGHFEIASRHRGGFVFGAQPGEKLIGAAIL